MKEDQEEIQKRFKDLNLDFNDANKVAEALTNQLRTTPAYVSWRSILRDLFALQGDTDAGLAAWVLLERLVTQLSLNKTALYIDRTSPLLSISRPSGS